ncbi:hypothetical protein ACFLT5_02435 [Chloroflexota bacterium]
MTKSVHREIKNYTLSYYGGGKKLTKPYSYRAIIGLWDDDGLIGALYFHDDPDTMPDGDDLPDSGQPMSHYPIEDFARVLDILRNEKPVYYQQLSNWPTMGNIRTGAEPVGEGELA